MEITSNHARIAHLENQLVWNRPNSLSSVDVVKKIGYIQLDTILTVARNHDIVCYNRSSSYKEEEVWNEVNQGRLFEDWAHARSLMHIDDFPYHYGEMLQRRKNQPWWNDFLKKYPHWPKDILRNVEENGPITIIDVQIPKGFPKSTGWNKPNRRILDYLSTRGYLMVKTRKKFQPIYDLPEKVVKHLPEEIPDILDKFWFDVKSTLNAIGPAPIDRLLQYKYIHKSFEYQGKKLIPRKLIEATKETEQLDSIKVKGHKKLFYLLPQQMTLLDNIFDKEEDEWQVFLLSPWDTALWSRESIKEQYNFDFKMEIYVPKVKRKYGYYVMPILWGHSFVGRVDVKLNRKTSTMYFLKWTWEPKFKESKNFWKALSETIQRFVSFHNADEIDFGNMQKSYLNKLLPHINFQSV